MPFSCSTSLVYYFSEDEEQPKPLDYSLDIEEVDANAKAHVLEVWVDGSRFTRQMLKMNTLIW